MRWTPWQRKTSGADADGEVVWSRRPDAGVKFRGQVSAERWWQKSPVTKESPKETVKTIAQGRPGVPANPAVTCSCAFFILHARLRVRMAHPAFPAPSVSWADEDHQ